MCVCWCAFTYSIYDYPDYICLALHVKGNDSCYGKGQKTNKTQAGDHLPGWRAGQGEVAPSLTSILVLIHYRLYMSKRLPSVDPVERACDAFVRLLSPQGSATLSSLTANSKHCYLE